MPSGYDLVIINSVDLEMFKQDARKSKIGTLIELVLEEVPQELKFASRFVTPYIREIEGFEDDTLKGFEICVDENKEVEEFIRGFIPFLILRKE